MNNYEAILQMTPEEMAIFLDQVYLTGLNYANYVSTHVSEDEKLDMDQEPFDLLWLESEADKATAEVFDSKDGEMYMLPQLVDAICKVALFGS
ncbi:MAG: hypothetical protein Q4G11_06965 [Gallicola sp.]|nr:hypothetical protein [Gallicola sp.]